MTISGAGSGRSSTRISRRQSTRDRFPPSPPAAAGLRAERAHVGHRGARDGGDQQPREPRRRRGARRGCDRALYRGGSRPRRPRRRRAGPDRRVAPGLITDRLGRNDPQGGCPLSPVRKRLDPTDRTALGRGDRDAVEQHRCSSLGARAQRHSPHARSDRRSDARCGERCDRLHLRCRRCRMRTASPAPASGYRRDRGLAAAR